MTPHMVLMGTGKPVTESARRAEAIRRAKKRRSRIILSLIIVTAIVVPTAVTFLYIGTARAQGLAIIALAVWTIALGFFALFQRPIPKSQSSWGDLPPPPPGMEHYR